MTLVLCFEGCDLSFPGNKLVSGDHCKITVDEESGQALLEDTRSVVFTPFLLMRSLSGFINVPMRDLKALAV